MQCGQQHSGLASCFPTSPGLARSLIHVGLSYGECQVPVTTKTTSLNETVTVVQECSFGVDSYWAPERICMLKSEPDRPNLPGQHSGTTCTVVQGCQGRRICVYG